MSEHLKPQPAPVAGTATHSVDLVIVDLIERKAFGVAKYGVAHQYDNGRNHAVDAYQEAIDLLVYLRAEIEKRRSLECEIARLKALIKVAESSGSDDTNDSRPPCPWCRETGEFRARHWPDCPAFTPEGEVR